MIDPPLSVLREDAHGGQGQTQSLRLPVPAGLGRFLVLGSVFVCAACGLVYELALVALASYFVGDAVTQASVVLSVMVFAMGIGSLLAKRLRCRASAGFGSIEALLALIGGGSAMGMHAWFIWAGPSRWALVGFSLAIGVLIGAEMPLLMTLLQRIRAQDAGGAVADLFAADCVGALVGGLAFPFVMLPFLGQMAGALLTGVVNAVAGGVVVLWLFRRDLDRWSWWWLLLANGVVVTLLATAWLYAGHFEQAARQAVYGGPARVAQESDVQEIVLTGGMGGAGGGGGRSPHADAPLRLFLDGRLKVNGLDEARYHESLVHPAMGSADRRARVLILGGGDGLALREVLRHPDVQEVTVVEIDPKVVELARSDPALSVLNEHAFDDPRVHVRITDAFAWLRGRGALHAHPPYDVVISDMPDPEISSSTKLYSQEFFGLASRLLATGGRIAVHADGGMVAARDQSYWTVDATLRSAGLRTAPYVVDGRMSGFTRGPDRSQQRTDDTAGRYWGFLVAGRDRTPPSLRMAEDGPMLRSLTPRALWRAEHRAVSGRLTGLSPSTLMHPRY